MIERYYMGAYWGIRKESAEQCAQRLAGFLKCLAECDPSFAHWFKLGKSRQEALKDKIKTDESTLQTLLLAGQHRTDIGHKVMENLGFLICLWNGARNEAESAGLTITCGSYAPRPGFNSCMIDLPYGDSVTEHLLRISVLKAILECVVSAWTPDWGVIMSGKYRKMTPKPPSHAPRVGWLTYLSHARGVVPSLPLPSRVMPIGTQGSLVITTDERFTANNPRHVDLAKQVTEELDRAGLLGPLT
jgi:hypothetical protein